MTSAWIFPGQGAQGVGMGRELVAESALARQVFEEADATLGFALTGLCFDGPEAALTATENAQPAILTLSVALLRVLQDRGVAAPLLVAGHSLGEYSALVAAGALDFPQALRLVRRRGELMAAAQDGTMAAVMGLELEPLTAICAAVTATHGPCVVANQNAPGQLVISGASVAVEAAGALAREAGARRVLPLSVSAAFHSPLMAEAAALLEPAIARAPLTNARILVISNVTAQPICAAAKLRTELVAQMTAPVRWIDTMHTLAAQGITTLVEIGPGAVLTGLAKRTVPQLARETLNSLADCQRMQPE